MMGIRPTKPGFSETTIRPEIGNLKMVEIRLPTAHGEIYEKITQNENQYDLELKLPKNLKARIELPVFAPGTEKIRVRGRMINPVISNNKYILDDVEGFLNISVKK
jgi:hypothetical protein